MSMYPNLLLQRIEHVMDLFTYYWEEAIALTQGFLVNDFKL